MEITTSHAIQLIAGLMLGIMMFVACIVVSPKKVFMILVILIPFQFVSSRFGSLNMILVYQVFLSFLIGSKLKNWPIFLSVIFIFLSYFLSTILAPRGTWGDHSLYLITIGSNFILFYITYNITLMYPDVKYFLRLLLVMNALAILYSLVLYFVGFERIALLGVSEWALNQNLEEKSRLMGAFNSAGITASFFAIQILFVLYAAFFTERGVIKYVCYIMVFLNFALVVASGSRGSFLSLMIVLPILLFFLRSGVGAIRLTRFAIFAALAFTALSLFIVTQTNFNVLFDRLLDTEVNAMGVPDTRQAAFELTIERIGDKFFLGHGPRIQLIDESTRQIANYKPLGFFPHNLILFFLYTVGMFGLVAYSIYFILIFVKLLFALKNKCSDNALKYMPFLGLIFMVMFFLDQLKIEFLRIMFADFQHYIFFLLGMLAAFAEIVASKANRPVKEEI